MNCLFIHVPKTGGTSFESVFSQFQDNIITENHPAYKGDSKYHQDFIRVLNYRLSRAEHFRFVLGEEVYDGKWSVGIVRNPWDRYVSNWKWLTRKESTYPRKGWRARGWLGEDGTISFESFVKQMAWCYHNQGQMHGYQHDKWHIRNQIEHLVDKSGNLLVTHVGRFENLSTEFNLICEKAGINQDLPHLNHTGHYSGDKKRHDPKKTHYSKHYTAELIDIVASRCKEDIEMFGYDYEEET